MEYPVRTRQWTRAEYDRLIEVGVFQPGDPVELLGGELVVAEPQSSPHYTAICLAAEALKAAFGDGWVVRQQGPIALDEQSEPEPDVAVVRGRLRDYRGEHPARPVLVVEVALSRLTLDRDHKGSLYARAGLDEYWIVNLVDRVLEVYRQPVTDAAAAFGWRYASGQTLGPGAAIAPRAAPNAAVRVADLLP
ncbi:MAG TPA: Uma2 family endonuclease [Methylomirabilota bacterium]|nr:Uma2 family endonuclease [Methylomirabilota bacterium]